MAVAHTEIGGGPGEESHALDEGMPSAAMDFQWSSASRSFSRSTSPDPLPLKKDEVRLLAGEKGIDLFFREGFAFDDDFQFEIEQCV